LIPFLVAGDPDLATTAQAIDVLTQAGADLLELGVPFSDPIADGPINQRSSQRALAGGVTISMVLDLVRQLRGRRAVPLVVLSYYNPILQYGLPRFCADAVSAGIDGLVIPDLPAHEGDELIAAARAVGLDTIFLLAPTSTTERIRLVAERASGFIYCVSLTGVTGVREVVEGGLAPLVQRIRAATTLPVCVGFGVSTPEQARQLTEIADGVIVGSALVSVLESSGDRLAQLGRLVGELRRAIDRDRVMGANTS
jgi:tryptophan synthase alpha chain